MVDDYSKVIKELRSKMTLSQVEFAQLLGVSFASVNRWETGKHEPTIKIKRKIKALMREYDVKADA
ncbi:MAG: helix-turn-helix domain-containing protein [Mollicutes bacterium]|jgi:DNA-binding transcriptional regulator YiaG|nr:helix-turn-helix domain-containing protein [Mollicutes bacterium]